MVSAEAFLQHFRSDRSHMLTPNGDWISPPPPYECIHSEGETIPFLESHCSSGSMCSSRLPSFQGLIGTRIAIM